PVAAAAMRPTVAGAAGVFRVRRLVRSTRPDVVQTWLYHADLIGGLAARSLRIPVVWGVRQTAPDTAGNKRHTRLAAALGARLSSVVPARIVCNSEAARLDHVAMGYDASRMVVIPNGVDTDRFRPAIEARHASTPRRTTPPSWRPRRAWWQPGPMSTSSSADATSRLPRSSSPGRRGASHWTATCTFWASATTSRR